VITRRLGESVHVLEFDGVYFGTLGPVSEVVLRHGDHGIGIIVEFGIGTDRSRIWTYLFQLIFLFIKNRGFSNTDP